MYEAGIFPVRKEKDYFPVEKVNIRNTGIFVRTIKGVIVYGGLGLIDFGLKSCILKKAWKLNSSGRSLVGTPQYIGG